MREGGEGVCRDENNAEALNRGTPQRWLTAQTFVASFRIMPGLKADKSDKKDCFDDFIPTPEKKVFHKKNAAKLCSVGWAGEKVTFWSGDDSFGAQKVFRLPTKPVLSGGHEPRPAHAPCGLHAPPPSPACGPVSQPYGSKHPPPQPPKQASTSTRLYGKDWWGSPHLGGLTPPTHHDTSLEKTPSARSTLT